MKKLLKVLINKLDEIAKQNELRDGLLEESIEKGKELEELLHKKEQEIHMIIRDFEEQQSEKENQIHHLKATATNTIRNLYALNGLTGENISNNIEAQQLKRSISNHSLDIRGKDSKKKVSFEGLGTKYSSTLGATGNKGDMTETININKSTKLLSPYRKRNAAYTHGAKSSMKKSKDAKRREFESSVNSVISPLSPTTPWKQTKLNRTRDKSVDYDDNDFERNDQFIEEDKSIYGIPNTIDQIESTCALVTHLKNLLNNALERESKLTDFIEKMWNEDLQYLKKKYDKLYKANYKMREDSERLLMRNEELETRLLDAQSKLWTLKLLYDDYDELMQQMNNQKDEHVGVLEGRKSDLLKWVDDFLNLHGIPRKRKDGSEIQSKSVNDFEDEIHLPTLFSQATDLINDLKNRLKESQNVNKSNMQAIDSLKKELEELDKINERLENQLYKYQYDITRITDVLLNEVYPSAEELEQEEEGIEDMSEQEQHLYLLLKRASNLRDKEKDYSDKINVYVKDIEELMDKNRFLSNIEEIK